MTGREPDTRELLAQALDLVVGAVSLSRYASNRAGDARQRRVFQQVAAAGQQQERLLKEQLAQFAGVHRDSPGTDVKRALAYAGATAIGTALAFLCGAIAFRLLTVPRSERGRTLAGWMGRGTGPFGGAPPRSASGAAARTGGAGGWRNGE